MKKYKSLSGPSYLKTYPYSFFGSTTTIYVYIYIYIHTHTHKHTWIKLKLLFDRKKK